MGDYDAYDIAMGALLTEESRLREASYQLHDGREVWYDAGDAVTDAAHLWAVLEELHGTGSPNVENLQAKALLDQLQQGRGLGEFQIATLRRLLKKHERAIERFRRRPEGQDLMDTATDGADARIITKESHTMADDGLFDGLGIDPTDYGLEPSTNTRSGKTAKKLREASDAERADEAFDRLRIDPEDYGL